MVTKRNIEIAKTRNEIWELVEQAASELNCELDDGDTYAESAEWFEQDENRDGVPEMARILRAAEKRWFEITHD